MYLSEELCSYLLAVARNPLFQLLAPFAVLFLVPFIAILFTNQVATHKDHLLWSAAMVLESLGLGLPWNWSNGNAHVSGSSGHERKKSKKKHTRTKSEHVTAAGQTGSESSPGKTGGADDGYYPGLVNISGTYCFMNSTLQAMASLSYLQPHIDAIYAKAVVLDVPSPVIDALRDILHDLNTPKSYPTSFRPLEIISALSNHSPGKHNSLFSSREHQDAQELFQLLSECIKNETAAIDKEENRDRGLGGLGLVAQQDGGDNRGSMGKEDGSGGIGKSMFDGLTANRRSCMECGYTEAVMHFAFDNWQLAVPRMSAGCALEACLADYTKLELLTDCICRKCSLLATHKRLAQEAERLAEAMNADPDASMSKKRRVKEAKKLETKIKLALEEGRIEDDIKGVKMDKVFSKASTKQAMIARPPPVLALHLNRSIHSGHYAAKNNIRIIFPEILDLTSFTTSGNLSTIPSIPISTPPPSIPRSTTPTPATYAIPRTIYRLSAVVCHYGQHSFGHYVCYRRKPRPLSTGTARFTPPKLADPLGCECEKCERFGPVRDDDDEALNTERTRPGYGWLRISDESVKECGIETVLQEGSGAFMLYYERVVQARPGIYPLTASPRSSEETLKPLTVGLVADANLSTASLATVGNGLVKEERKPRVLGPRIVRSVAPARGRSVSAAPSERESMFVFSREESASKSDEPPLSNGNAKPPSASIVLTAPSHATLSASLPNLSSPPATPATPPPPTLPSLEEVSLPTSSLISTYPPLAYCVQAPQPTHPGQSQMVGLRV